MVHRVRLAHELSNVIHVNHDYLSNANVTLPCKNITNHTLRLNRLVIQLLKKKV